MGNNTSYIRTNKSIKLVCLDQGVQIEGVTARLFIRSYKSKDYDLSASLYRDPVITRYFDHGQPRTPEEINTYIKGRGTTYFQKGLPYGLFSVFLKDSGQFIGQIDLVPTDTPGALEIGWIFKKQFHGKGYCSEAGQEFLMPLIDQLVQLGYRSGNQVINKVIATAHPDNQASRKVITKLGLKFVRSGLRYSNNPRNWFELNIGGEV